MRKLLTLLTIAALALLTSACHDERDDLFATAIIVVDGGDDVLIDRVQAQVMLTNLNTRQTTTASDFDGDRLSVQLLRGAYQVLMEGAVRYHTPQGLTLTRQFRATTDYVGLSDAGTNLARLDIIFLD